MTDVDATNLRGDDTDTEATGLIARAIVAVYKEQFGRGPTRVKVTWADADTLLCILDDTLTPAERKLLRVGSHEAVRSVRSTLHYATLHEFCGPVEEHTGRKVRAYHSSIDTLAGGQVSEVFVLHPRGFEGESRADLGRQTDETQ